MIREWSLVVADQIYLLKYPILNAFNAGNLKQAWEVFYAYEQMIR